MKKKHALPLTFFIVMFLYNFGAGFAHPVTPTLVIERGLPSQWYGYAGSAVSIGSFAIAPFWGKLCNYVPTRTLTVLGLVGYVVGQMIMMTSYSGPQLLIGRLVAGLLSCAATIGLMNYIMNVSDEKLRPKYLTIYATSQSVSNAAGFFCGGWLGAISLQTTFFAQAIICLLAAVVGFFVLEDDTPYKYKPMWKMRLREVNPFAAFMDAGEFMTPLLLVFFISFICIGIGTSNFENSFNYYMKDFFGYGSQYNGTIKAVIAVGGLVTNSTLAMWIINKTNLNKTVLYTTAANAVFTCAAVFFFHNMWGLAAMFILYSIANFIFISVTQNLVASRSTPATSNSMMGFYQAMRSFGSVIGSFLQANLYAMNCYYAFYFAGFIMIVGTLLAVVYRMMYRKETRV